MEISTEKSQILVNSNAESNTSITVGNEKLKEVTTFKYLGVTLSKDGTSTVEIRKRIAMATSVMTQLAKIWKSSMSLIVKVKLYKSLVLSTLLYGCEAWTLTVDAQRRIRAFESKCYRRLLRVSYTEHRKNEDVLEEIEARAGPQEPLLVTVKRRKLSWFGHHTRHDSLSRTVLHGTVEGNAEEGAKGRCGWKI